MLKYQSWYAYLVICIVSYGLYGPFFSSPPIFDDHNIISNLLVYSYAQEAFSSYPRTFPYFSIGLVHVLSEAEIAWNRGFNLVLHCLVILSLFFFLRRACSGYVSSESVKNRVIWLICGWMALNPVAVYGVGYLVQRTIVFATLFGLLSATLYLRAQQASRSSDVLSAALMAGLAMMSKEHAVLLPAATVVLTPLVASWNRHTVIRALGYLALTAPCVAWIFLHRGRDYLGNNYEVYAGDILAQITGAGSSGPLGSPWLMSVATQLILFWKYLFLWLFPNPQWMSADLRVDFSVLWGSAWAYVGLGGSVAVLLAAVICWLHPRAGKGIRRWSALIGFVAIPFVVELSTVRVQEAFVLYRSYLWMPGYALLFAQVFMMVDECLSRREGLNVWLRHTLLLGGLLACVALFPLAQNRLSSFSSEEALWRDAEAKLSRPNVPGSDRIYYNLAGEAFKRKDYGTALDYSDKVIHQNPDAFQGYLARGTTLMAQRDTEGALAAFNAADEHRPPLNFRGYIEFKRCGVYSTRGEKDEVIACLRRSASLGYEQAKFQLRMAGLSE